MSDASDLRAGAVSRFLNERVERCFFPSARENRASIRSDPATAPFARPGIDRSMSGIWGIRPTAKRTAVLALSGGTCWPQFSKSIASMVLL